MKFSRRFFLEGAGGTLIASFLPFGLGRKYHWRSNEDLIRLAGKKRGLAFTSLMVDELPDSLAGTYEATYASLALRFNSPSVQLIRAPSISDITRQRKYIGPNRNQNIFAPPVTFSSTEHDHKKAIYAILTAHDITFIDMLHHIKQPSKTILCQGNLFSVNGINESFASVEMHDLMISKVLMHPETYITFLQSIGDPQNVIDYTREMLEKAAEATTVRNVGHIWSAGIVVSDLIPPKRIFTIAPPEFTGVVPIPPLGNTRSLVVRDNPAYLDGIPICHDGKHFTLTTGMTMVNNYSVSCVELTKNTRKYDRFISERDRKLRAQRAAWNTHRQEMAKRGVFYKSGTRMIVEPPNVTPETARVIG